LKFPSFGSIVSKELGLRNNMPPFAVVPIPTEGDFFNLSEAYQAAFIGSEYDGMILPDRATGFQLPNLNLPKSVAKAINDRRAMLSIVDRHFRQKEELAEVCEDGRIPGAGAQDAPRPSCQGKLLIFLRSRRKRKTNTAASRRAECAPGPATGGGRLPIRDSGRLQAWPVDTHDNNEGVTRTLAPLLDQSLSALMGDLNSVACLEHGGACDRRIWAHTGDQSQRWAGSLA
jgi:hypothetical protein